MAKNSHKFKGREIPDLPAKKIPRLLLRELRNFALAIGTEDARLRALSLTHP